MFKLGSEHSSTLLVGELVGKTSLGIGIKLCTFDPVSPILLPPKRLGSTQKNL